MGTLYQFIITRESMIASTERRGGKIIIKSVKDVVLAEVEPYPDKMKEELSEELLLKTIQMAKAANDGNLYLVVG